MLDGIGMLNNDNYEVIGYRFISSDYSSEPKVGDILENSHIWDGDEITETELNGTCAFETRSQIESYAKYSKGNGWIVTIGGDMGGRGDDFVGEIYVKNAEVLEVSAW